MGYVKKVLYYIYKKHGIYIYIPRLFKKMKKAEKNEKNKKNFKYFLVAEILYFVGFASFRESPETKKY